MQAETHSLNAGVFRSSRGRAAAPGSLGGALGGRFSKQELRALVRLGTKIDVAVGRNLIVKGRVGQEVFVVVDGTAEVVRDGTVVAEVGPGSVFGEIALLESAPRNASVIATSDLAVFALNQAEFSSLLGACPRVGESIRAEAARRQSDYR